MRQEVSVSERAGGRGMNTITAGSDSIGLDDSAEVFLGSSFDSDVGLVVPERIRPLQKSSAPAFTDVLIRGFDLVGSLFLLSLAAPVMVFTALLIKISSTGPVFYTQLRVGKLGKIFKLYKFRTMVDNAEEHTGPVWASKDDGRVTPVGKILRCSRVDELPQLFNVFTGDMSLVGPRPERPYFVRRHNALQGVRLSVKPGITGLAQVRACYNLKPEHKLKYDYLYIQKRSFSLNTYILLMTIPVVLLRRGW